MHSEKTTQFKKYLADLVPVWKQAAATAGDFKAEANIESMMDASVKRIQAHITSLKDDAGASDEITKAWAKNAAALAPLDLEINKLTESLKRQRAAGAVDPKVEEELKRILKLRQDLTVAVEKENKESANDIAAKTVKNYRDELMKLQAQLIDIKKTDPFWMSTPSLRR